MRLCGLPKLEPSMIARISSWIHDFRMLLASKEYVAHRDHGLRCLTQRLIYSSLEILNCAWGEMRRTDMLHLAGFVDDWSGNTPCALSP